MDNDRILDEHAARQEREAFHKQIEYLQECLEEADQENKHIQKQLMMYCKLVNDIDDYLEYAYSFKGNDLETIRKHILGLIDQFSTEISKDN